MPQPSAAPSAAPSSKPSSAPSTSPSAPEPSSSPTASPSSNPSHSPSSSPTVPEPSSSPTVAPSHSPSSSPTTPQPTGSPTAGAAPTSSSGELTSFSLVNLSTGDKIDLPSSFTASSLGYNYDIMAEGSFGGNWYVKFFVNGDEIFEDDSEDFTVCDGACTSSANFGGAGYSSTAFTLEAKVFNNGNQEKGSVSASITIEA
ncbi:expressed unknown protein [Seminavis robusta]|uniref:Uncharacterized protein n=1 Tax=Seminavis robusta TaxID=568900 RepID=A0A9N8DBQ4_9STRA|nr:expressed unknown protein [Seminavis robusta]|eukprot:Sro47_g027900.1 n/a (201) ;mRNA; r:95218-95820